MMIDKLYAFCKTNRTARNITISDVYLQGIDLKNLRADTLIVNSVDLSQSSLDNIQWRNCQLSQVNIKRASLKRAAIRMCEWKNVHANHSDFSQAKFENSSAQGCIFDDANFSYASLIDNDFSRTSLQRANFQHAVVTGLNLRGADLREAKLSHIDFTDVDLRGADLRGAILDQSDLQHADTRGAIFDKNTIDNTGEKTKEDSILSPEMQELANTLSPLVSSLLKEGADKDLLSQNTFEQFMQELEEITPTNVNNQREAEHQNSEQFNDVIHSVLQHAGAIGIDKLLEALNNDTPSEDISKMIIKLTQDVDLKEGATTEDLLAYLMNHINHKV